MTRLIVKRLLAMVPTLAIISIISFIIIELPPGSYLENYAAMRQQSGETVSEAEIEQLNQRYGLDAPVHRRYAKWIGGFLRGDFGYSLEWNRPVRELISERMAITVAISLATLLFTWGVAIPIGIYSAVRQYSWGDYAFTFIGFLGMSVPNFLLALIFMYVGHTFFGMSVGGLFSPEYVHAPWSWVRALDLLKHVWVPIVIIGAAGTAGLVRIMRGNLLDELRKPYVVTARAKGVPPVRLLLKYPVRLAINPLISTVGYVLPAIFSGAIIVSVVLNLPMVGPLLLQALINQDMYLAGSIVMILALLTAVGTLLSDLLLMALDPRIRAGDNRVGGEA